jgi:ABC-2 type transport system ATP-binding protein
MDLILDARGLAKAYGGVRGERVTALDRLDLAVAPGQVVALLGPNGAGKTTFVRTVATLVRPDAGSLHIDGVDALTDPRRARRLVGLAGQHAAVEGALTGRENLQLVARLFGHDVRSARRAAGLVIDQLGLVDAADRLARTYSGGMRRRLDLGASLVGAPRLLLLDEPTTGLDPGSRIELWDAIRSLVAAGTDVLLTTQYLDEADQLADCIVIIDGGRVIATGSPAELKAQAGRDVVEVRPRHAADVPRLADTLGPLAAAPVTADVAQRRVAISVDDGPAGLMAAMRALDGRSLLIDDIALRQPTLDEVFLALTGRRRTDEPAANDPEAVPATDDHPTRARRARRPRRKERA